MGQTQAQSVCLAFNPATTSALAPVTPTLFHALSLCACINQSRAGWAEERMASDLFMQR